MKWICLCVAEGVSIHWQGTCLHPLAVAIFAGLLAGLAALWLFEWIDPGTKEAKIL